MQKIFGKWLMLGTILLFYLQLAEAKVGLVLSGGGARGIAHVGVLKVIDELDIQIDYIAGTSIGAVVGALYAMGYSADQIEELLLNNYFEDILDDKVSRENLYIGEKRWLPFANVFFDLGQGFRPTLPRSFFSGNRLTNKLHEYYFPGYHLESFDQLPIPFRAVATNIVTGEKQVFSSGSLQQAVRASMSVPSIIAPFEMDGELYIDGGVRNNFPTEVVKEMGADTIIGVKVNTGLKSRQQLNSLLQIYDQTVNISITDNVENSEKICDIMITPQLDDIRTVDFAKKEEIISSGEAAARQQIEQLAQLPKNNRQEIIMAQEKISFARIRVKGNKNISSTKVREFVGLQTGVEYDKSAISQAIEKAYNSLRFATIYPVVYSEAKQNILCLYVQETNDKRLGMAVAYSNHQQLVVSATLEMNNVLQRNSKFLLNLKQAGKKELNLDYVKNYGKFYGAYYRIFAFLREYETYSYNQDHQVEKSVLTGQGGTTLGLGFFAQNAIILEFYGYALKSRHYQHIAEFENRELLHSGIGLKAYHESVDDIVFPTRGGILFGKISLDRPELYSDIDNTEIFVKMLLAIPLGKVSLKYGLEYGAQNSQQAQEFSPFFVGGIDSFLGLFPNEMNAPVYQLNKLSLQLQPIRNFFLEFQYNSLTFGESSQLLFEGEPQIMHGVGMIAGLKRSWLPIRAAVGLDEDWKTHFYLSVGYEFDDFFFSRK
ncbi:MAG: patatin-like phospholipase family protein [Candidatus Cloacimonadales bacterium]